MRGRSFPVATGLVVALALLGGFRSLFQSTIPPHPANRLLFATGEYLQQAIHQPVDWRPLNEDSLAEARRLAKPILLVIGAPWSETARTMDAEVFSNNQTAALINETFVPIRVDAVQQPRWFSAFLPLARLEMPFDPDRTEFLAGFQVYVLDTKGQLLSFIPAAMGDQDLEPNTFNDDIALATKAFSLSELSGAPQGLTNLQRQNEQAIQSAGTDVLPTFDDFLTALDSSQRNGGDLGFSQAGVPRALPMAWSFQLRTGRRTDLATSMDPLLLSSWVDLVRGGFFSFRKVAGRTLIDFDQVATRNAEMAALLSEANAVHPDPLYDRLAHDTFDMLLRDLREQKLFDACREGDQGPKSRSASASFPDKKLNEILSNEEHDWAGTNLGLNVGTNRQMVPYLPSRTVLADPLLDQVLTKLRNAPTLSPTNAGVGCMDVNGHVAAYLLRCARLWGDRGRQNDVLDTVDAFEPFRRNADVVHLRDSTEPGTYLGDYLGYADAQLEDFLITGRSFSFQNGLAVLERAMERFSGGEPGLYLQEPRSEDPLLPRDIDVPELADDVYESSTAQMIRLLTDYGRMLGPGQEGRRLLAAASDTASRYANLPAVNTPRMAGFYLASAGFEDSQCAFAAGPRAQEMADQLYRLRPARLIAAAFGPVRPDLHDRKPGVYVCTNQVVAGPYSVEQAATLLSPTLQVGVLPN